MVIVASLREVEKLRNQLRAERGVEPYIFRTSIGGGSGMSRYRNLHFFNPTWEIVNGYKSGKLTEAEYRAVYDKILDAPEHEKQYKSFFRWLENDVDCILLCHCPPGAAFCHRYVLADRVTSERPDITVEIR